MKNLPPFVILSAVSREYSADVNADRMTVLARQLTAREFAYGNVIQVDQDYGEEAAYIVPLSNTDTLAKTPLLYQLARHYSQPNVLFVDAGRLASVVDLAPGAGGPDVVRETVLGTFENISPLEADLRSTFIRDSHGLTYAVTT